MDNNLKNITEYLSAFPQASLQDYLNYAESQMQKEKQNTDKQIEEWNKYFNETYVGKYVIVEHHSESYTVFGPIREIDNREMNIKRNFLVIDIFVSENKVSYNISGGVQRPVNALWLYYPIKYPNDWTTYSNNKVTVITEEKYKEILARAKEHISNERKYIDEIMAK